MHAQLLPKSFSYLSLYSQNILCVCVLGRKRINTAIKIFTLISKCSRLQYLYIEINKLRNPYLCIVNVRPNCAFNFGLKIKTKKLDKRKNVIIQSLVHNTSRLSHVARKYPPIFVCGHYLFSVRSTFITAGKVWSKLCASRNRLCLMTDILKYAFSKNGGHNSFNYFRRRPGSLTDENTTKFNDMIFTCILHQLRVYYELTKWPSPSRLHSSVGRAPHRYRRSHWFESRSGPIFFQAFISQLSLSWVYNCDYKSCLH